MEILVLTMWCKPSVGNAMYSRNRIPVRRCLVWSQWDYGSQKFDKPNIFLL
uniref:Uncharacterized protein n=1 Tax=Arundo donax TaxID=35708 RepID=A0A0A9BMH9_ARUDO